MISNCKNNKTFKLGKGVTNYDMRGVSNVIKYAGITIGIIVLLLLDCMALYRTISVAHSWINNIATGVVNSNIGCLIYSAFLILEMIFYGFHAIIIAYLVLFT